MKKKYTGFTSDTQKSLLLDAGAFFRNFTVGTDTYATAVTAGKLIGATKGGGEFAAVPKLRTTEVDGVPEKTKGLEDVEEWQVHIKANVIEIKESVIESALAGCTKDTSVTGYHKFTASNEVAATNYIENITWVGTLSGEDKPVIIQIYNALNTEGLTIQTKDKENSIVGMTFTAHYDVEKLDEAPFAIFYPVAETTQP